MSDRRDARVVLGGSLSSADLRRLVGAFCALRGMRDRNTRDMYVGELERELGAALHVHRQADAQHDVGAIVLACMERSGGIWALVDLVESFHAGSLPMKELHRIVSELFARPLLHTAERVELHRLLHGVRCHGVAEMYRVATPFGPPLPVDPGDIPAVVDQVGDLTWTPAGLPPLFVFLEVLMAGVTAPVAAALRAWVDLVANRLDVDTRLLRDLRTGVLADAGAHPNVVYVVTLLQQDRLDPDGYLMSVWLQRRFDEFDTLHHDEQPRRLDDVPECLEDILSQRPELGADVREVVLEFVLPRHILGYPVDQWRVGRDLPHRLGVVHPVVVRDLQRIRARAQHPQWRRKWARLVEHGHRPDGGAIHWEPQLTGEALMSRLLMDDRRICLVLPAPPSAAQRGTLAMLGYGLLAGVPVVVWCRDDREPDLVEREVIEWLRATGLRELPTLTLRLRREAQLSDADPAHLGRHLTLLWDDADRLPPTPTMLTLPSNA